MIRGETILLGTTRRTRKVTGKFSQLRVLFFFSFHIFQLSTFLPRKGLLVVAFKDTMTVTIDVRLSFLSGGHH